MAQYKPKTREVLAEMGRIAGRKIVEFVKPIGPGFYDGFGMGVALWHNAIGGVRLFRKKCKEYDSKEETRLSADSRVYGLLAGNLSSIIATGVLYCKAVEKTGSEAALLVPVLTSQALSSGYEFYKYAKSRVIEKRATFIRGLEDATRELLDVVDRAADGAGRTDEE